MTKFIPVCGTGNRVVLKRSLPEEKSKGGIIFVPKNGEHPNEGTIVGLSEIDLDGMAPRTQIGDKVMFSGYGGTPIKIDGEEYMVMVEKDVLIKLIEE